MKRTLAGLVLALLLLPFFSYAQDYPTKAIRVVVPFPPGGTSDIIGRTLGVRLSKAWSQPVIMDNRAGVAGSLGAAVAVKAGAAGSAPGDGDETAGATEMGSKLTMRIWRPFSVSSKSAAVRSVTG